jgi:hypothetical protein
MPCKLMFMEKMCHVSCQTPQPVATYMMHDEYNCVGGAAAAAVAGVPCRTQGNRRCSQGWELQGTISNSMHLVTG